MTRVTCRSTAKNRNRLRNSALGNRVRATFFAVKQGVEQTVSELVEAVTVDTQARW